MPKILKAKDIERLENTSAVSFLPAAGIDGAIIWTPCGVTCEEGACTGSDVCGDVACTGTCGQGACTGSDCNGCIGTCVTHAIDAIAIRDIDYAN